MWNKLNALLSAILWAFVGGFAGLSLGAYLHYQAFSELYETQSAPWYFHMFGYAAGLLAVAILCLILKLAIRKKRKAKKTVEPDDET